MVARRGCYRAATVNRTLAPLAANLIQNNRDA
jgi:hypothetical protein